MAADDEGFDWILDLYETQRPSLYRLARMLGASSEADSIVRTAFETLYRRRHRVIDPQERVEYLREQVVHLTRGVGGQIDVPVPEDIRHRFLIERLEEQEFDDGEILVVSHFLGVFGPELSRLMRLSVRRCNLRLEGALEHLASVEGAEEQIEALSQELTKALRSAGAQIKLPQGPPLEQRLLNGSSVPSPGKIRGQLVAVGSIVALALGAVFAVVTGREQVAAPPAETASPSAAVQPTTPVAVQALVRNAPVYFVGRADAKLYREYRNLPSTSSLPRSGVESLITLVPNDPDYKSPWVGQVRNVTLNGGLLTVDLSAATYEKMDPALRSVAIAQMVWTMSDLLGDPDLRVQFLSDGSAPPSGYQSKGGFARRGLSAMPGLWITSPTNQGVVPVGTLSITGTVKPEYGAPTVSLTNTKTHQQVANSIAQTGLTENDEGWLVWSVTLPIREPGTYEVIAAAKTQATGSAGPRATVVENKVVRVTE